MLSKYLYHVNYHTRKGVVVDPYRHMYKERCRVERCFAWEDTYRKLVIRYERLHATHLGFKYLAFTMINLRWFLGKNTGNSL